MADIKHVTVETNGIRMHVAEAGEGPLVVLCHGFPESWYSWRHQLTALAQAGYRAVAPDMRGYGKTDGPRRSASTRCCTSSATWSASSMRSASGRQ
jgi:pimeloyl-ACP methyl ester carboxylesterase